MNGKTAVISSEKISKKFGEVSVLDGLDIEIYEGDLTVIMGTSGAGKSTLLYALSGMDSISGGDVLFRGRKLNTLSEKEMAEIRAKNFGFVFQQANLVSNLTLFENAAVAGYIGGKLPEKAVCSRAKELFEEMNVIGAENRLPSQTSGGEAQRAAIVRAIMNRPDIIFADEPTGALNKANTDDVLDIFTRLNGSGQTILMVTHDMRAAVRGNRLLYLEDGRITGELSLPKYCGRELQKREKTVEEWLSGLRW